jgi:hypothetical protein
MSDISGYDWQDLEDKLIDYIQGKIEEKFREHEHQMYIAGMMDSVEIIKEFFNK